MNEMICLDTLKITNWPPQLSDAEKEDFLIHFGAKTIKVITSKYRQKTVAYAKFENEEIAKKVLFRLHQFKLLDCYLCVEYAKEEIGCEKSQSLIEDESTSSKKHYKEFLSKLHAFNASVCFYQPPPPHLKYEYPKPNRATLNNIAHALATVPKFYVQVLHLMNRMNLPPPFSNIPDPEPLRPMTASAPAAVAVDTNKRKEASSSESELESDPETQKSKEVLPQLQLKREKKQLKRPKFIKPIQNHTASKPVRHTEDVFEKVEFNTHRKIELKVSDSLDCTKSEINITGPIGTFGIIETPSPEKMPDDFENETEKDLNVITEKELASNRILPKDFGLLPTFHNYHPGAPSCRLYIKNLSRTVQQSDLERIYRRYYVKSENEEEQGSLFDVRLMKEGRMKGQAFVTLQNVELAQKALSETNGFILKDKPMVVVFARSAVPKSK